MSELKRELQRLLFELEQNDVIAAGNRLKALSDAERSKLLKMARERPSARRRMEKIARSSKVLQAAGAVAAHVPASLDKQLENWPAVFEHVGGTQAQQVDALRALVGKLRTLASAIGDSGEVVAAKDLEQVLQSFVMPPDPSGLSEGLLHALDEGPLQDDPVWLCVRALAVSWGMKRLPTAGQDLFARAFEQLIADESRDQDLLEQVVRVLQLDALRRADFEYLETLSDQLRLAGSRRARVLSTLELALLRAREGEKAVALDHVSQAAALAMEDADLRSHVYFVEGEVEALTGDVRRGLAIWGAILKRHSGHPTPSGTCRAALNIAKAARQASKREEELAAYRIAARCALTLDSPYLVEQAFLGWGRARVERGESEVEAGLLSMVPPHPAYARLLAVLSAGVLSRDLSS